MLVIPTSAHSGSTDIYCKQNFSYSHTSRELVCGSGGGGGGSFGLTGTTAGTPAIPAAPAVFAPAVTADGDQIYAGDFAGQNSNGNGGTGGSFGRMVLTTRTARPTPASTDRANLATVVTGVTPTFDPAWPTAAGAIGADDRPMVQFRYVGTAPLDLTIGTSSVTLNNGDLAISPMSLSFIQDTQPGPTNGFIILHFTAAFALGTDTYTAAQVDALAMNNLIAMEVQTIPATAAVPAVPGDPIITSFGTWTEGDPDNSGELVQAATNSFRINPINSDDENRLLALLSVEDGDTVRVTYDPTTAADEEELTVHSDGATFADGVVTIRFTTAPSTTVGSPNITLAVTNRLITLPGGGGGGSVTTTLTEDAGNELLSKLNEIARGDHVNLGG